MTLIYLLYWTAIAGLLLQGANCYVLSAVFLYHRRRTQRRNERIRAEYRAKHDASSLPFVTVQLPVFNERYVVARLLHAVRGVDYPRDRFEIQVLDDSTDDTSEIIEGILRSQAFRGVQTSHLRRVDREGYKAGALRDGLRVARGELIVIFDADFVPLPDFLHRTVPFFGDPGVGLVQTRWGHVNETTNVLTRVQALAIDGHFGIEQAARCSGDCFLNFNGTAGIWRRDAIESAGGWSADTLTEDLDLSYRSQLVGWKVEYLPEVVVPAELPADLPAFRSQQRRWAKGSIQTLQKLGVRLVTSKVSAFKKIQAMLHLSHYFVHPLMLSVALLAPFLLLGWRGAAVPIDGALAAVLLVIGTLGPTTLYVTAQSTIGGTGRLRRLLALPGLVVIGTGISVSNTRGVVEALLRKASPFARTPKRACMPNQSRRRDRYTLPADPLLFVEAALSLYCAFGFVAYLRSGSWLLGPFLGLYALGYGFVSTLAVVELVRQRRGFDASSAEDAAAQVEEARSDYEAIVSRFGFASEASDASAPARPNVGNTRPTPVNAETA